MKSLVEPPASVARKTIHPTGDQVVIDVSENLHLTIIISEDASAAVQIKLQKNVSYCALEVFLEPRASLSCLLLQAEAGTDVHIIQRARLADGARLHWQNATFGGGNVSQDLQTELTGANAESTVDWAFYARGNDKYDLRVRNIYAGRDGGGEITMKGVAQDKAHVRCDGMIEIGTKGTGTDAYLTEDVLMLDPTAKIDAIPGLEIKTNDVKASHSATVSRVTPEDLFYFAARGIPRAEARRMYVLGFLASLFYDNAAESLQKILLERLATQPT
ncbi:MAG TPA: SufD family Fe-S cluster assembly protein [Candidatus Peribacteraceae bacterium]|nr:SufD family Fe-S cluster assembly protein [Candidatus Peribacteraceae bacterium]